MVIIWDTEKGKNRSKCDICGKWFTYKQNKKIHVVSIHEDEKLYKYEFCGKFVPYKQKNKIIMLQLSMKERGNSNVNFVALTTNNEWALCFNPWICYHNLTLKNINWHIMSAHMRNKPFKCEIYDHSFSQKENMHRHVASIHKIKTCDHSFSQKVLFHQHITSVHIGKKQFKCQTWDYSGCRFCLDKAFSMKTLLLFYPSS